MASFRCYDNSDVIATLIITNFDLHLTQVWWQTTTNKARSFSDSQPVSGASHSAVSVCHYVYFTKHSQQDFLLAFIDIPKQWTRHKIYLFNAQESHLLSPEYINADDVTHAKFDRMMSQFILSQQGASDVRIPQGLTSSNKC